MKKNLFILVGACLVIALMGCQHSLINKATLKVDTDTIIVGGGITGLTSAYCLNEAGKDFLLLEKEDHVGGKAESGFYDGFYYARGTEYIGKPEGILHEMIKGLDLQVTEIPSPMDIHYVKGRKYYDLPGLINHLVEESSVDEFNRFILEVMNVYDQYEELPYFKSYSSIAKLDNITAGEWFKEKNFSQVYYDTYNVTSKGLFGATLDEVSALNMVPEIAFDFGSKFTISQENVENYKNYIPTKKTIGSEAYSFVNGIADLPIGIYEKVKKNIYLSCFVTNVELVEGVYHVTYTDTKSNASHVLTANNVILAVPAPVVPLMAKSILTEEQATTLTAIPYASYITAALYTDEYMVNDAFDIAVDDGMFFTDVYDSTWVQRSYDQQVKDKENSILSVYIAPESYRSKKLNGMTDQEILDHIYDDFAKFTYFKGIKDHVIGYDINLIKYAYPIMVPGAYERLQKLHNDMNGSFQLAGDYMIYPTVEGAVESGEIAAKKIISSTSK